MLARCTSSLDLHMLIVPYWYLFRTLLVPKVALGAYHAIFKCPALAGHFKSITDKLRLLNLPPDLSSLCRFRDDAGWGLAVDAAKLIFTAGVAAHI